MIHFGPLSNPPLDPVCESTQTFQISREFVLGEAFSEVHFYGILSDSHLLIFLKHFSLALPETSLGCTYAW